MFEHFSLITSALLGIILICVALYALIAKYLVKDSTFSGNVKIIVAGAWKFISSKWTLRTTGIAVIIGIAYLGLTGLLSHKITVTIIGLLLVEAWWLVFFRPAFGKMEAADGYKLVALCILRGFLYLAVITGIALGL